jgi:hypothetical protein
LIVGSHARSLWPTCSFIEARHSSFGFNLTNPSEISLRSDPPSAKTSSVAESPITLGQARQVDAALFRQQEYLRKLAGRLIEKPYAEGLRRSVMETVGSLGEVRLSFALWAQGGEPEGPKELTPTDRMRPPNPKNQRYG